VRVTGCNMSGRVKSYGNNLFVSRTQFLVSQGLSRIFLILFSFCELAGELQQTA
jgi:hypothetical protein